MLEQVLTFLLIWGEAANLRFMPECLAFLFEVARASLTDTSQPAGDKYFLNQIIRPLYVQIEQVHWPR